MMESLHPSATQKTDTAHLGDVSSVSYANSSQFELALVSLFLSDK